MCVLYMHIYEQIFYIKNSDLLLVIFDPNITPYYTTIPCGKLKVIKVRKENTPLSSLLGSMYPALDKKIELKQRI